MIALFDTIADVSKVGQRRSRIRTLEIVEKAETLEDLVWNSLQDALSMCDAEQVFGYRVDKLSIKHDTGYQLYAAISAKTQSQDLSRMYVKGISKFDLKVEKAGRVYKISVVVDV